MGQNQSYSIYGLGVPFPTESFLYPTRREGLGTGPDFSSTAWPPPAGHTAGLLTELLGLVGENLRSQLLGVQELWEAPHHGLHQVWGEDATQLGVHAGPLFGQTARLAPGAPGSPWAWHRGLLKDWGGWGQLVRLRPVLSRWKGRWQGTVVSRDTEVASTYSPSKGREGRSSRELRAKGTVAGIRALRWAGLTGASPSHTPQF